MARRYRECIRCNAAQGKLKSLRMWLLTFPRRWLCQRVSTNILPTNWLRTVLQLKRSRTILHGLPPVELKPGANSTPTVPTFAFLGRLVSTKGAHVLLKAAQQLKAKGLVFQLKIIGQGPDRQVLERLASDLQILNCVQFLGHVPTEQLGQDLTGVTAVVMPSLAGEVFGLVAAENMEQGRLVIVSDHGALAEVVGDAGLRFVPGDASDLARCMEAVIADPLLAVSLGRRASQRIAHFFSADRMEQGHLQVYEELCGHRLG
jgi:glycosyltransferase involved in cell wall biosynthesis